MGKRREKSHKSQTNLQELVVVTFADNMEQAHEYEALLKANEISVVIKERNNEPAGASGFAVMVPEDFIDEAHVIIESQDSYDDFYDLALDEEEDDFDSDIFEDEF